MTILKFIQRKTERVPAHVKKHTQRLLLIKQLDKKHKHETSQNARTS